MDWGDAVGEKDPVEQSKGLKRHFRKLRWKQHNNGSKVKKGARFEPTVSIGQQ
jgi:hypothetical protein